MLSRYLFVGRRSSFRRDGETPNRYVDRYGPGMIAVMTAIFAMCVLDAIFTLVYIQNGGAEANPVMAVMIEAGVFPFYAVKCGMTIVGILFLCLHKNFRMVKVLIGAVLVLYTALLGYHLYLAALL
jgi:hypothetical protein